MKQHTYCLTFVDSSTGQMAYASVYAGFDEHKITLSQIADAKGAAGVTQAATLLSCSYLGHMTQEEFDDSETA
ncbi:hypothetical protein KIH13_04530 [Pseudomonas viridiflava]|nr:hypothetical protein KIH13_04530 [Pseudomonas viridiflava]